MSQDPEYDPLVDELPSRYVVGIDLGTTNIAVTYVDMQSKSREVKVFSVLQIVAPGETEERETLPSFHFQPLDNENSRESIRLPWQKKRPDYCVGVMARDETARTAGRAISSAKSWLCHAGVDRTSALLPWHSEESTSDVDRLSPVEVSARYLDHIRRAWNHRFSSGPLEQQDIILTLPASFDEVARTLTVEAASRAKLPRVVLIEEPQAAFYAWVNKHAEDWQEKVNVGQKILVCDIGGGTTDFTLIRVRESEIEGEKVQFHRVAVGNHLILGGDNLDLALAKHLEQKISPNSPLKPDQWDILVGRSRQLKEDFLGQNAKDSVTLKLPSRGSKLIGGGLQTEISREEVHQLLVEGFLPDVDLLDQPVQHVSGFQEFGLPYASDAAITRYLASFLVSHRDKEEGDESTVDDLTKVRPDVVLFNGGFFDSPVLRQRTVDSITNWFQKDANESWQPIVLENDRLDLAVARGAAYYGMVRRGEGVRISASLARSYYIGVGSSECKQPQAVCLVPGDAEPGQSFELAEQEFRLRLSEPVEFSLHTSSTQLTDQPGKVYEVDPDQMTALPPIRTVIRAVSRNEKRDISVRLHVELTEIGTIELSCREVESERSWKLQFDVRSAVQTDVEAHTGQGESEGIIDESQWQECSRAIIDVFGEEGRSKPKDLPKMLSSALGSSRDEWPMSLLRRIWETLFEYIDGRKKSESHELRWLNLLGYSLRPGYGFAVDDWRVTETWRHVKDNLVFRSANSQAAVHILWRRLAGGLSKGQQNAMAEPLIASIRSLHKKLTGGKVTAATMRPEDTAELWRLLGSFELLSIVRKTSLAKMIRDIVDKRSVVKIRNVLIWTLGRLGQRTPLYGPLNTVIPAGQIAESIEFLLKEPQPDSVTQLAVVQMSRLTHDRFRDIPPQLRSDVVAWLKLHDARDNFLRLVEEGGSFDEESQGKVFGESLPRGLSLA